MNPSILNPDPINPENSLKRILITGGCGFIGRNLIIHLFKEYPDTKIRVLDNLSVGTKEDLSEVCNFTELNSSIHNPDLALCSDLPTSLGSSNHVELFVGDIRDFDTCLKCCKGVDVVIHLAANAGVDTSVENPLYDMEANVNGTFNMLDASKKNEVQKFIFASSVAPIGETEPPIHEEKVPRPVSPYGASKLAGEGYCSAYYRTFGLKTVTLRFANIYGPLSKHKTSVVSKFLMQALNEETLEIYGDGSQTRDFIFIDDLTQAIILAINPKPLNPESLSLNPNPWGEVFQIATFKETTVNEITDKIKELVESGTGKIVKIIYSEPRIGDVVKNYSDISKARKILGYEPKFDLDLGLKRTFEYFKLRNEKECE